METVRSFKFDGRLKYHRRCEHMSLFKAEKCRADESIYFVLRSDNGT